ncbi:MAG: hypothetical protein Q8R79_09425 [Legionellaceae bacterium]|nr:hypothetical protein [Legionellaceae bacterium]
MPIIQERLDRIKQHTSPVCSDVVIQKVMALKTIFSEASQSADYFGFSDMCKSLLLDEKVSKLLDKEVIAFLFSHPEGRNTFVTVKVHLKTPLTRFIETGFSDGLDAFISQKHRPSDRLEELQQQYIMNTTRICTAIEEAWVVADAAIANAAAAASIHAHQPQGSSVDNRYRHSFSISPLSSPTTTSSAVSSPTASDDDIISLNSP